MKKSKVLYVHMSLSFPLMFGIFLLVFLFRLRFFSYSMYFFCCFFCFPSCSLYSEKKKKVKNTFSSFDNDYRVHSFVSIFSVDFNQRLSTFPYIRFASEKIAFAFALPFSPSPTPTLIRVCKHCSDRKLRKYEKFFEQHPVVYVSFGPVIDFFINKITHLHEKLVIFYAKKIIK